MTLRHKQGGFYPRGNSVSPLDGLLEMGAPGRAPGAPEGKGMPSGTVCVWQECPIFLRRLRFASGHHGLGGTMSHGTSMNGEPGMPRLKGPAISGATLCTVWEAPRESSGLFRRKEAHAIHCSLYPSALTATIGRNKGKGGRFIGEKVFDWGCVENPGPGPRDAALL